MAHLFIERFIRLTSYVAGGSFLLLIVGLMLIGLIPKLSFVLVMFVLRAAAPATFFLLSIRCLIIFYQACRNQRTELVEFVGRADRFLGVMALAPGLFLLALAFKLFEWSIGQ